MGAFDLNNPLLENPLNPSVTRRLLDADAAKKGLFNLPTIGGNLQLDAGGGSGGTGNNGTTQSGSQGTPYDWIGLSRVFGNGQNVSGLNGTNGTDKLSSADQKWLDDNYKNQDKNMANVNASLDKASGNNVALNNSKQVQGGAQPLNDQAGNFHLPLELLHTFAQGVKGGQTPYEDFWKGQNQKDTQDAMDQKLGVDDPNSEYSKMARDFAKTAGYDANPQTTGRQLANGKPFLDSMIKQNLSEEEMKNQKDISSNTVANNARLLNFQRQNQQLNVPGVDFKNVPDQKTADNLKTQGASLTNFNNVYDKAQENMQKITPGSWLNPIDKIFGSKENSQALAELHNNIAEMRSQARQLLLAGNHGQWTQKEANDLGPDPTDAQLKDPNYLKSAIASMQNLMQTRYKSNVIANGGSFNDDGASLYFGHNQLPSFGNNPTSPAISKQQATPAAISPQDQQAINWAKDPSSKNWDAGKAKQILAMHGM